MKIKQPEHQRLFQVNFIRQHFYATFGIRQFAYEPKTIGLELVGLELLRFTPLEQNIGIVYSYGFSRFSILKPRELKTHFCFCSFTLFHVLAIRLIDLQYPTTRLCQKHENAISISRIGDTAT